MVLDVLKKCTVEGHVVKLPEQLDRSLYVDVKGKLEAIGGKWKGGKVQGFVFEQDPTDLLGAVAAGVEVNLKQQFQYFPTPMPMALEMVGVWACMKDGMSVLEPSAGRGNIVRAIAHHFPGTPVDCYELMDLNRHFLGQLPTARILGEDFLQAEEAERYDRVIGNPPFAGNQDIAHVQKMYRLLKPGGRLVSIMSRHWEIAKGRKEQAFQEWFDCVGGSIQYNGQGAFAESGTNVDTVLVIIDKDTK